VLFQDGNTIGERGDDFTRGSDAFNNVFVYECVHTILPKASLSVLNLLNGLTELHDDDTCQYLNLCMMSKSCITLMFCCGKMLDEPALIE